MTMNEFRSKNSRGHEHFLRLLSRQMAEVEKNATSRGRLPAASSYRPQDVTWPEEDLQSEDEADVSTVESEDEDPLVFEPVPGDPNAPDAPDDSAGEVPPDMGEGATNDEAGERNGGSNAKRGDRDEDDEEDNDDNDDNDDDNDDNDDGGSGDKMRVDSDGNGDSGGNGDDSDKMRVDSDGKRGDGGEDQVLVLSPEQLLHTSLVTAASLYVTEHLNTRPKELRALYKTFMESSDPVQAARDSVSGRESAVPLPEAVARAMLSYKPLTSGAVKIEDFVPPIFDREPNAYVVFSALLRQYYLMTPTQDRSPRSDVQRMALLYTELLREATIEGYAAKYPQFLPPGFVIQPLKAKIPPLPATYDPKYNEDEKVVSSGAAQARPPADAPIEPAPVDPPTPPCAQPKRASPSPAPALPTITDAPVAAPTVAAPRKVGAKATNAVAGPSGDGPVNQARAASAAPGHNTRAACEYTGRDPFESVNLWLIAPYL